MWHLLLKRSNKSELSVLFLKKKLDVIIDHEHAIFVYNNYC